MISFAGADYQRRWISVVVMHHSFFWQWTTESLLCFDSMNVEKAFTVPDT